MKSKTKTVKLTRPKNLHKDCKWIDRNDADVWKLCKIENGEIPFPMPCYIHDELFLDVHKSVYLAVPAKLILDLLIDNNAAYHSNWEYHDLEDFDKELFLQNHYPSMYLFTQLAFSTQEDIINFANGLCKLSIKYGVTKSRGSTDDKKFRALVHVRDNFKCCVCNDDLNIVVHHLESWSNNYELRFEVDNGVTLCDKHHNAFHKHYGNRNNTKQQYQEWIIDISRVSENVISFREWLKLNSDIYPDLANDAFLSEWKGIGYESLKRSMINYSACDEAFNILNLAIQHYLSDNEKQN